MKRTVSAESVAKLIVLLVNELCVRTIKKPCVNYIVFKNNFMRALVISGGDKGRSLEVSHNIFRKKKNMIFLLVLQLEVYLFRISP
jgi:hypothetical protein